MDASNLPRPLFVTAAIPSFRRPLLAVLQALSCLLLGSCSLFTTMWGPPKGFVPLAERPRSHSGHLDFKGIIHCHSYLSHDSTGTVEEIAEACADLGLDFLVMTDHQTPYSVSRGQRGMVGETLFITGAEIRVPGGSLLAFPLQHFVRPRPSLEEVLADIHAQGGLAIIDHAERFTAWDTQGLDGIEILNLHAAAKAASRVEMISKFLFTPMHVFLSSLGFQPSENLRALDDMLQKQHPFLAVGGNDAHANIRVFGPLGGTIGTYAEIFRTLSTHVQASELSEEALVQALRQGRCFVVFDLWRDGSGFDFWAQTPLAMHGMGASLPAQKDLQLRVHTPALGQIRLLRNGEVVARQEGQELHFPDPPPGIYRVEVDLAPQKPWIFANSIRVQPVAIPSPIPEARETEDKGSPH